MDLRARFDSDDELFNTIVDAVRAKVHTAIPVKLTQDSDGHTVSLQPLVKFTQRMPDGTQKFVQLPVISDAPINHHSGGGVTITHPHKKDDEGIYLIASRSLDNWFQQGDVQPQADTRMHSLSDGFYIPGVRSTPRKLKNVSTTSTQIRSDDGKHFSELNPKDGIKHSVGDGKHVVTMNPDGGIKLAADGGKHIIDLAKGGISIDSAMSLAVKAARGIDMKGALNVDGKVTSTKPIGGSVLAGVLQGGIGALLAILALSAMQIAATGHPEGVQQASYRLAALWSRP